MTILTKNRPSDLRLKRDLVPLTAIIANYVESFWSIFGRRCPFAAAFRAALRRHQISLVENFLLLLGKKKGLIALNARRL